MLRILIVFVLLIPTFANAKYYNGSSWVTDTAKYYNGSAWVTCAKKYYNGSAWAEIEAAGGSCATSTLEETIVNYGGNLLGSLAGNLVLSSKITTVGEVSTSCGIDLYLEAVGTPTQNVTVYIFTDNVGVPGTQVTNAVSTTVASSSLNQTAGGAWQHFEWSGSSPSLAAATTYHVLIEVSVNNADNHWKWYSDSLSTGNMSKAASTAGAWTSLNSKNASFKLLVP